MLKKIFLFILLSSFSKQYGQFQFTGSVNDEFKNATAYLSIIDDCNKKSLFLTENILQESSIDSSNTFHFSGDFLAKNNRIYKIHIDNCNENISDYKHLLNHCENSIEIDFIASNSDTVNFPLNDLSQVFCSVEYANPINAALYKIEALQEELLANLQYSKSDLQRKNNYQNYFTKIKNYSKTFNEPLAELYTFHLYANDNSFSKSFYLNDLKKSNYYNELLDQLTTKYPNSNYTKNFKNALIRDQYPLLKTKNTWYKSLAFIFGFLLIASLLLNYFLVKKYTSKIQLTKNKQVNYKEVLTSQEQKVFELMSTNSNKQIAETLFVSLSTIKTHINSIYSKLSISSRKDISSFF